eukprot:CAMPEP_0119318604 /NCGR_PEP_ID=MMETSP1333-20130426/46930_1 /TAXON_ID=418940 /ORGANISM="Scyphosphaera apsteinii, Strain RCC1455" /LENGTH=410 /DNA_ID=CAMNT_0007324823 /DNA_START=44 /DNA_END=1276 /DNA_ORIENTATION=-
MNLHESFASTFDTFPGIPENSTRSTLRTASTTHKPIYNLPTAENYHYGFGTSAARFQNTLYPSHFTYGMANNTIVQLTPAAPAAITSMPECGPSRQLPAYASSFATEEGHSYSRTVEREPPRSADGLVQHWVQPKDIQSPLEATEPPDLFTMSAPPGVLMGEQYHKQPNILMTPAERREAVVFAKCNERARRALRKAANDACRLTLLMQNKHPNGVLGLESAACADSIIYAKQREQAQAKQEAASRHAQARHDNLKARRDTYLTYPMLAHDPFDNTTAKIFPHKAQVNGRFGCRESDAHFVFGPSDPQSTAYRSNQEVPLKDPDSRRTQNLLDVSTRGKRFDIVTGCQLPTRPSDQADPSKIDRRAHESNVSLPKRLGTAPTLIGPIPDEHELRWQPACRSKNPSQVYLR